MSVWKTSEQKPLNDNDILIVSDKACFVGHFDEFHDFFINHSSGSIYGPEDIDYWATLEDLVSQANKSDRLQKAVTLAILRLEQGKVKFGKSKMGPNKETAMLCEIVIDEIKRLIEE